MKNISEIAKGLRNEGFKFGQRKLLVDLEEFVPTLKHGRFSFYEDTVLDTLILQYRKDITIKKEKEVEEPTPTDLESIKRMLEAICKGLGVEV